MKWPWTRKKIEKPSEIDYIMAKFMIASLANAYRKDAATRSWWARFELIRAAREVEKKYQPIVRAYEMVDQNKAL